MYTYIDRSVCVFAKYLPVNKPHGFCDKIRSVSELAPSISNMTSATRWVGAGRRWPDL